MRDVSAESNLNQVWQLLKHSDPWFAKSYGEEPSPVWVSTLKKFSATELLVGYKKYIESGNQQTIKLAEFIKLCKSESKAQEFPYQTRIYETPTERQKIIARKALDKIKEGL